MFLLIWALPNKRFSRGQSAFKRNFGSGHSASWRNDSEHQPESHWRQHQIRQQQTGQGGTGRCLTDHGRGHHEEDEQEEDEVDHRREIHLQLVAFDRRSSEFG